MYINIRQQSKTTNNYHQPHSLPFSPQIPHAAEICWTVFVPFFFFFDEICFKRYWKLDIAGEAFRPMMNQSQTQIEG